MSHCKHGGLHMESNKIVVAEWELPHGEGSLEVMVPREAGSSWLSIPVTGNFFLWHKPYCGAPVVVRRVTDQKMVMFCQVGCGFRLELMCPQGLPQTLGELGEALSYTCQHSDLPARI